MKCPKCHADNPDTAKFCGECGTQIKPPVQRQPTFTRTLETPFQEFSPDTVIGGRYQIIEEIGRGGMGVVYKAQDTKLKRTVALKFLSPQLTRNQEAKDRFVLEAQAASALDHPNICTIYEIDEADGRMFIAMAFVEGESLSRRITAGPLKLDAVVDIASQIARGLYAAHEKGIVHRDIKSSNIMVTEKGQVKVMDFGVAKLEGRTQFTKTGTTMGTIAYMSPEQARGDRVDHLTDIWSLGVIIHELVTGQLPFKGEYEQAVVYSILNENPEPLTALRTGVPMELERIVSKALSKDPAARYQHADDLAVDLKAAGRFKDGGYPTRSPSAPDGMASRSARTDKAGARGRFVLVSILSALVTFFIVWNLRPGHNPESQAAMRFTVSLNPGENLGGTNYGANLAISPDGRRLVYQATADNITQLYLRPVDEYESTPLSGTEDAEHPFFSPDGRWIGFFQSGLLKKLRMGSTSPVMICEGTPQPNGAAWSHDGSIIFSASDGCLVKVDDSGGTPGELTRPNAEANEWGHGFPRLLPGDQNVLFQVGYAGGLKAWRVAMLSLKTNRWEILLDEEGQWPAYANSGHVIFTQSDIVMAVPIDLSHLEIKGSPFPVLENVFRSRDKPIDLDFSLDGNLIYASVASEETENELVWVDRQGHVTKPKEDLTRFHYPRISPGGEKSLMVHDDDLYVYDMDRSVVTQLTFRKGVRYPVWSPNGKSAVFVSEWKGRNDTIHSIPIEGAKEPEELLTSENPIYPTSWSRDGLRLAFYEIHPATQRDIWVLSLKDRTAKPIIATRNNERAAMFSPDGRYIAYVSNDTGRDEIFVQTYPITGAKWQVSHDGGIEPLWAPDGGALYYKIGNRMMSVRIETEPAFSWEKARLVFEGRFFSHHNYATYNITPDGELFLMTKPMGESVITEIHVVLNWFEELKRLGPVDKH